MVILNKNYEKGRQLEYYMFILNILLEISQYFTN